MQAIRSRYKNAKQEGCSNSFASDRFDVRIRYSKKITQEITEMNRKLYKDMMDNAFKELYGRRKK